MSNIQSALQDAQEQTTTTIKRLTKYLSIPAISCDPSHKKDIYTLANHIVNDLQKLGLKDAQLLEIEGALPCVSASLAQSIPHKPTVLIYGHYDLQPVKGEPWDTPPHDAVEKNGRLYARGAADDMGGWVSHFAAIESLLKYGDLPCNVKFLIEGEEEIGSPNLEKFMDLYPQAFAADVMVLTDCENPSTEIPGLTVSLRGLLEVELLVKTSSSDVHSGLWGNIAPDPALILIKLLNRVIDDNGRFNLLPQNLDPEWLKASFEVPLTEDVIRQGAHLLPGVSPLPLENLSAAAWVWRQPAITVLSSTLPAPGTEKNAIRKQSSMKLSVRIPPGVERKIILQQLQQTFLNNIPSGAIVELNELPGGARSWLYTPQGPAFAAADRAYIQAWGRPLLPIGIGGSIPFVAMFGERFSDLPLILNGVMDPQTTAHGPNESLHLGVFQKAIQANILLLHELGQLTPEQIKTT